MFVCLNVVFRWHRVLRRSLEKKSVGYRAVWNICPGPKRTIPKTRALIRRRRRTYRLETETNLTKNTRSARGCCGCRDRDPKYRKRRLRIVYDVSTARTRTIEIGFRATSYGPLETCRLVLGIMYLITSCAGRSSDGDARRDNNTRRSCLDGAFRV